MTIRSCAGMLVPGVLLVMILAFPGQAAEDWTLFGDTASGKHYLERSGVYREGATRRVWVRTVYSQAGITERVKESRKLKGLAYSMALHIVDCANRTVAIVSEADYDKNGDLLAQLDNGYDPAAIPPGTLADLLADEVCAKAKQLKKHSAGKAGR